MTSARSCGDPLARFHALGFNHVLGNFATRRAVLQEAVGPGLHFAQDPSLHVSQGVYWGFASVLMSSEGHDMSYACTPGCCQKYTPWLMSDGTYWWTSCGEAGACKRGEPLEDCQLGLGVGISGTESQARMNKLMCHTYVTIHMNANRHVDVNTSIEIKVNTNCNMYVYVHAYIQTYV